METIKEFRGENYYLSNFYNAPVIHEGIIYLNNEAAFQAAKCINKKDRVKFQLLPPNEAKKLGRSIKLRADWEDIKNQVMYEIVYNKFKQNLKIKEKLIETDGIYLEEGNTWHDNYWGHCHCDKCKYVKGLNVLGKTLMIVRKQLKENK